ncbi:MAG: TfoX/Sxy family protein [Flavobacteriales bacterium]|nr:TfoX/Sxy family protein [Flavobacteriales bacterium]HPF91823.1 TfoX/Sxy family protein [Flavobacteriales bacterium]
MKDAIRCFKTSLGERSSPWALRSWFTTQVPSLCMPHDPLLEKHLADVLLAEGVLAEPKKMFGGVAFMVKGHMSVGITNKGALMVRFDPQRQVELEPWPGARPMDFTGKPMKGFLFVDADAVSTKPALTQWIRTSLDFVTSLPPKVKAASSKTAVKKKVTMKKSEAKKAVVKSKAGTRKR